MREGLRRVARTAALDGLARLRSLRRARREEIDLTGQVVLITGASRGLGYLLARDFGRAGCRVAICARDQGELERARVDLTAQGIEVFAAPCDVSDQRAVEQFVTAVTRHFGRIDVLVNNAGIIQVGPLANATVRDFEEAMGVMFWGALYPTLAVLPQMRTRRAGRIVNITSIGGKISAPHLLPYDSAKFAAVGLSEGLRAELARDGIAVTTVVPGLMRTGSHRRGYFKGQQKREYWWFSLGATLPLISMDAERAAAQVVGATRRGDAEVILGLPATVAARVHGLFPGLTSDLLAMVNRLLPDPGRGQRTRREGGAIEGRMNSPLFEALTGFGRSAARRFHQQR